MYTHIYIYILACTRRYPSTMNDCWQAVLVDLAVVLAFLRSTLKLAAVLAVPFVVHLAPRKASKVR